jgi:hypothetical protein
MPNPLHTATISTLNPDDANSWQGKLFLTIDMEWASDQTLAAQLDWLDERALAYTIFVTHDTPLLARLRANPRVELGIHPNFNGLLQGYSTPYGQTVNEVLQYFKTLVPEATALRSHCLTSGSLILAELPALGITHECNALIPIQTGQMLAPWQGWIPGITHVTSFWEDDVHCVQPKPATVFDIVKAPGLKVVNFHPVTWRLNLADMGHYKACKPFYQNDAQLVGRINQGAGVQSFLTELLAHLI